MPQDPSGARMIDEENCLVADVTEDGRKPGPDGEDDGMQVSLPDSERSNGKEEENAAKADPVQVVSFQDDRGHKIYRCDDMDLKIRSMVGRSIREEEENNARRHHPPAARPERPKKQRAATSPGAVEIEDKGFASEQQGGGPNFKHQVRNVDPNEVVPTYKDQPAIEADSQNRSFFSGSSGQDLAADAPKLISARVVPDDSNSTPSEIFTAQPIIGGITIRWRSLLLAMIAVVVIATAVVLGVVCGTSDRCRQAPTIAPFICSPPNTTQDPREDLILDFLRNTSFSTISYPEIVAPQDNAVCWLIHNDPLNLKADDSAGRFRLTQRYALLTLLFQSPENQISLSHWMKSPNSDCHWFGISCVPKFVDNEAGNQDAVTLIKLSNLNLHGKIPSDTSRTRQQLLLDRHCAGIAGVVLECWKI